MGFFDGAVLFTFVFSYCVTDHLEFADDTLGTSHGEIIFAAMVFRHGDRNQVCSYPNNPHDEFFKKAGIGELNMKGKIRSYELGLWTRRRYNHVIQDLPYTPALFHMLSSDADRTIRSAQLFFAGFYPPTSFDKEIWNKNILWQPIAVHTIPRHRDRLIMLKEYCALYNREVLQMSNSPEIQGFYHRYKNLFDYIEEKSLMFIPRDDIFRGIQLVSSFYDCFYVAEEAGLKIPDWATGIYPHPLNEAAIMYFKLHTISRVMKRIKGGPLLDHIIKELTNKQNDPQSEKLFQFYSSHDNTLVALMDALGIYNENLVPYSASLIIELRKKAQDYIVTVLYRATEKAPPKLMEIPDCENPCTFDKFVKATKLAVPEYWEKECENWVPDYNTILF